MQDLTIQATTIYDEQLFDALSYLMLNKLRKWPRYAILSLGLVTSIAAGMIMFSQGHVSALPFLVMILGSMLCMIGFQLRTIVTKLLVATYGEKMPEFHYTFSPSEIQIVHGKQKHRYAYASVLRMLEMSGLLFIFMKDKQLYILHQTDVEQGYSQLKRLLEYRVSRREE